MKTKLLTLFFIFLLISLPITSAFQFAGKEWDGDTRLYYFGRRYYDPSIGRFITVDPILSDTNPYAYGENNPLVNTDPNGMQTCTKAQESQGQCIFNAQAQSADLDEELLPGGVYGPLRPGETKFEPGSIPRDPKLEKEALDLYLKVMGPAVVGTLTAAVPGDELLLAKRPGIIKRAIGALGRLFGIGGLSDDVARTFAGGKYTSQVLKEDIIVPRFYGGKAPARSNYLTLPETLKMVRTQEDVMKALKPSAGNTAENLGFFKISRGTEVYFGRVAGSDRGAMQIYIRNKKEAREILTIPNWYRRF